MLSPGHARGRFKSARAFRSPCIGIPWRAVTRRETVDERSGAVLEMLYPRKEQLSVSEANKHLDHVADLVVNVEFKTGGIETEGKAKMNKIVSWADATSDDDDDLGID